MLLSGSEKKGISTAANKSSRQTLQGLVGVSLSKDGRSAVLLELNCETDFVGRNELFIGLLNNISLSAQSSVLGLKSSTSSLLAKTCNLKQVCAIQMDVEQVHQLPLPFNSTQLNVLQGITDVISQTKENIQLRRLLCFALQPSQQGLLSFYVHNTVPLPPSLSSSGHKLMVGRMASLVALSGPPSPSSQELAEKLAMHIVAAKPSYLSLDHVPNQLVEQEKDLIRSQAQKQGKAPHIIDKLVNTKMAKFYQDHVLSEQLSMVEADGQSCKVSDLLNNLTLLGFAHYQCGERLDPSSVTSTSAPTPTPLSSSKEFGKKEVIL